MKYTLLPLASQCPVLVMMPGVAIVMVATPLDMADCFPTAMDPVRFGMLNVVDPSHAP